MDYTEKAVKVFQTLAERVEKPELLVAHNKMRDELGDEYQVKNIRIPILTEDEDVKEYIEKFQLNKPENMIRFFLEANFAAFESTKESVNELKEIDLRNSISKVKAAESQIKDAMNDKDDEKDEFNRAKWNLDVAIQELISKIEIYVDGIRNIDNRSKWQFFLKSKVSLTDIDTYVNCAEYALQALLTAVDLQRCIAAYRKKQVPNTIDDGCKFIREQILDGDTCLLLHAYAKDKQEEFWLKIGEKCKSLIDDNNCIVEYVDEYDDIDFS